jgi:hypothetical protein
VEFYKLAVEQARDRNDIPTGITFAFLAAFDPIWKTEERGWHRSEQFTGLFNAERTPKPAVTEVRWSKRR